MLNWFKRSGHATVVAYLALFLAVGGGAFAIAKGGKINGSKLKKRSVAGKKLKKNTITGTEVNENKLGTVPTAKAADTAGTANLANVASSVATQTVLPLTKTGSSATGATDDGAAAAATPVTLYEDSHFRIYGKCYVSTAVPEELEAKIYIATKQDGAIFDSDEDELSGAPANGYLNTGTEEPLRELIEDGALPNSANMQYEGDTEFGATGADGYTIYGFVKVAEKFGTPPAGNGPYGAGNVCMFTGFVFHP
jgi:hypothetical protein